MPRAEIFAYVNGKTVPAAKATISIFDRGLVLGDGLFETLRTVEGHPQFLDLHYRRLKNSAHRLRLRLPITETKLRSIIQSLCRKSGLSDAAARITLTRGRYQGGLSIDPSVPPSLIITVAPVTMDPAIYTRGVKVAISGINKAAASGLDSGIKSTNYLANIFAKAEADRQGCYEAILLGGHGEIAELSTASFFCVIGGAVITPPLETGILPGITRQVLLREIRRAGIPCREHPIFPRDIVRMNEALLSSSVRGPVPISRIAGRKIGNGKVGPFFLQLQKIYAKACEKDAGTATVKKPVSHFHDA